MNKTGKYNFYFYGDGTHTGTAPIIATAEMWGNHIGYTYIDRHYGNGGSAANNFNAPMQGTNWFNAGSTASTNQLPNFNAYLAAIESHNPNANERYRWIPQGLPYDLFDGRNDGGFPIMEDVVNYSYQQSFNALQLDVRSIPAFRDKLLQLNGNNQQAQVNALFNAYNY